MILISSSRAIRCLQHWLKAILLGLNLLVFYSYIVLEPPFDENLLLQYSRIAFEIWGSLFTFWDSLSNLNVKSARWFWIFIIEEQRFNAHINYYSAFMARNQGVCFQIIESKHSLTKTIWKNYELLLLFGCHFSIHIYLDVAALGRIHISHIFVLI